MPIGKAPAEKSVTVHKKRHSKCSIPSTLCTVDNNESKGWLGYLLWHLTRIQIGPIQPSLHVMKVIVFIKQTTSILVRCSEDAYSCSWRCRGIVPSWFHRNSSTLSVTTSRDENDGRDTIDDSDADDDSAALVSVGVLSIDDISADAITSRSMSRNSMSPCLWGIKTARLTSAKSCDYCDFHTLAFSHNFTNVA